MLPSPSTDCADFKLVYEPAEDSFLLLDVFEIEKPYLNKQFGAGSIVVEVGTGTGIVSTFVQKHILQNSFFLTTDINENACTTSISVSRENESKACLDSVRVHLADGLKDHSVDILIFNPPYVPDLEHVPEYPTSNTDNRWVDLALLGGIDGMEVTWRMLNNLDVYLSENGVAYILFCQRNNPQQVVEYMNAKGWLGILVEKKKAGWEILSVYRFQRLNS